MHRLLSLLLLGLLLPLASPAKEAPPVGDDPVIERRMSVLAQELRCLVCQNQTIADSQADLAGDLREEIRQLMRQGKTDQEVKDYMVARYGDFVLYRPPLKTSTVLLWFGPALLLLGGLAGLYLAIRRRRRLADGEELGAEAHQRAQQLLAEDSEEGRLS